MSSCRERSMQRSTSVLPPPLVRKIYGLQQLVTTFLAESGLCLHSYTVFVLTIENFHCLNGFRNRTSSADQDTINVERESKGVGSRKVGRSKWGTRSFWCTRRGRNQSLLFEIDGSQLLSGSLQRGSKASMVRFCPCQHHPVWDNDNRSLGLSDFMLGGSHT